MIKTLKNNPVRAWIFATPLFIFALFFFRSSSFWQFRILMVAAVSYLLAAFLHHKNDKTMTLEIMIEYILIAALVLIIAQGLFY